MLIRPCFLVVDHEVAGGISTRKLVLETAKFNVITVYSCEEALATLDAFPGVHAVVLNGATAEHCPDLLQLAADRFPRVKRVLVTLGGAPHELADQTVESFRPDRLLETLRQMFPQQAADLERNEETLERDIEKQTYRS